MSIQDISLVLGYDKDDLSSPEAFVLIALANHTDEHGCTFVGRERVAKYTKLTSRCVTNCLGRLEEKGFITRKRQARSNGSRTTDLITLRKEKLVPIATCETPARS